MAPAPGAASGQHGPSHAPPSLLARAPPWLRLGLGLHFLVGSKLDAAAGIHQGHSYTLGSNGSLCAGAVDGAVVIETEMRQRITSHPAPDLPRLLLSLLLFSH